MFKHSRIKTVLAAAAVACTPVGVAFAAESDPPLPPDLAQLDAGLAGHASAGEMMRGVSRELEQGRHLRLRRKHARLLERPFEPARAAAALRSPLPRLRALNDALEAEVSELDASHPPILEQIAACESGGDPRAIGGGGTFRGKYQFMQSTWEAVGGTGDPAAAPEAEQDRRAAMLLERSGPGQWPVCGA